LEAQRFDTFARLLARTTTRRRLFFSLALSPFAGILAARHAEDAAARRKRKKRAKKPKPNEYGCLEIGKSCNVEEQCCSGICEGKREKRKCRAHGIGTCEQNEPGLCEAGNPLDTVCNGECLCVRTTAGSNYCGTLLMPSACADCKKDADCEAQGFPTGTACVPFGGEFTCAGQCEETGMACIVPCGTPLPEG
jgi:hypothetical protein